jgi:hypothetical protein
MEDETVAPLVLSVFTFLGKYKPIGKYNIRSSYVITTFFPRFGEVIEVLFFTCHNLGNVNAMSIICAFVSVSANVSNLITLNVSLTKQQFLVTHRYTVLQETEKKLTDH